jgi:hypothetical protein
MLFSAMRLLRWLGRLLNGESLRVLFIGNSLTRFEAQAAEGPRLLNDLPGFLSRMSHSRGSVLETATITRNAASLEEHREDAEAGRVLRSGAWDLVVLQENSERAISDEAAMASDVRRLNAVIRAAGVRTALFSTWPPADRLGSGERLSRVYRELASEIGALRVPVGEAWARASLERPELKLRLRDGVHPSAAGAYLSACVFYTRLIAGGLADSSVEALSDDLAAVRDLAAAQVRFSGEDDIPFVSSGELEFLRSVAARVCADQGGVEFAVPLSDASPPE